MRRNSILDQLPTCCQLPVIYCLALLLLTFTFLVPSPTQAIPLSSPKPARFKSHILTLYLNKILPVFQPVIPPGQSTLLLPICHHLHSQLAQTHPPPSKFFPLSFPHPYLLSQPSPLPSIQYNIFHHQERFFLTL